MQKSYQPELALGRRLVQLLATARKIDKSQLRHYSVLGYMCACEFWWRTRTGESCWALPSISSFGVIVTTEYSCVVLAVGLDPSLYERSPLDDALVNFVTSAVSYTSSCQALLLYLLQRSL